MTDFEDDAFKTLGPLTMAEAESIFLILAELDPRLAMERSLGHDIAFAITTETDDEPSYIEVMPDGCASEEVKAVVSEVRKKLRPAGVEFHETMSGPTAFSTGRTIVHGPIPQSKTLQAARARAMAPDIKRRIAAAKDAAQRLSMRATSAYIARIEDPS